MALNRAMRRYLGEGGVAEGVADREVEDEVRVAGVAVSVDDLAIARRW